jgi:succinate dehydrogenase/fumarate reductase flavoprotein subunit
MSPFWENIYDTALWKFNKEESGAHERDDFNQIGDDRAVNVSVSCHNNTRIEVTGYLNQKVTYQ